MWLGIDEAGRGPVVGPLVLAGVWVRRAALLRLVALGVRDSKRFGAGPGAQRRRAALAAQIRQTASCTLVLSVDAPEVDRRVRLGELNLLEQELAAAVIASGPPARRIVADGERLFAPLRQRWPQLLARDRADAEFPVVAAASLVAKAERDAQFAAIVAALRPAGPPLRGGGYANAATASFLEEHVAAHGQLPPEVRRSWDWAVLRRIDRRLAGVHPTGPGEQLTLPGAEGEDR